MQTSRRRSLDIGIRLRNFVAKNSRTRTAYFKKMILLRIFNNTMPDFCTHSVYFCAYNTLKSYKSLPMTAFQLYTADTSTILPLVYADGGIKAGFPSPAQDYITESIDLNKTLIKHPASTFYAKVTGDSMSAEGITEGDILIIDRSIEAEHGDLAVCCIDGEFTLKRLCLNRGDRIYLMPSNRKYKPIEVTKDNDFMIWGVVIYTIKANRRRQSGTERW